MPSKMASSNLNRYLPTYIARISGTVVATTPQRNRLKPSCCKPGDKAGPGRDADDGDEDVEADRVHEPHGR